MAIYGLECDVNEAARQALAGAKAMMQRIEELNRHLGAELLREQSEQVLTELNERSQPSQNRTSSFMNQNIEN